MGWAVRDLVFHCAGDAQRALAAMRTPAAEPPDRGRGDLLAGVGAGGAALRSGTCADGRGPHAHAGRGGHGLAAVRARWTGS
ncbi:MULTISPECIES: hypothetical protein [Streptomyces]|uniref:hypothetical protein n=1 Tax=Streptomyces TaxID=1883 RepID=UPI000A831FDD|nr:hypothetical protein [Streptomyces sp. NRRL WC-3774]